MKNFDPIINHKEYSIDFDDIKIIATNGIFAPDVKYTYSSQQSINYIKRTDLQNKSVLDMGCGTGVLGIHCIKAGAEQITFSDVNKNAILNTKKNLEINNIRSKFEVVNSDVFKNIQGTFYYIFANLPISNDLFRPHIKNTTQNIVDKFLMDCKNHLNKDGKVLLNWGSFEDVDYIMNCIKKNNLQFNVFEEKKLGMKWYLFEIFL
jgi:16S rRNA G1207 methylase RsmC